MLSLYFTMFYQKCSFFSSTILTDDLDKTYQNISFFLFLFSISFLLFIFILFLLHIPFRPVKQTEV